MGFSLNTSPVEEEEESESEGNSVGESIEESFWQAHLWPPNSISKQSLPPPHPPSNVDHAAAAAAAFDFPILPASAPAAAAAAQHQDQDQLDQLDQAQEEEKTALTMNGRSRKRRRSEDDHVNGERERRKKMSSMFTTLHTFLPHLSNKVDKATIVDEAINLIKNLQTSIQTLQEKADELRSRPPKAACATFEPLSSTTPQLRLAGQASRESFLADYAGLGPNSKPNGPSYDEPGHRVMFQTWTSSNVVLNTFGKDEAVIMACSRKKPGVLTAIVAVLVKRKIEVEGLHVFCDGDHCSYMIHARLGNGAFEQRPNSDAEKVYKEAVSEMMMLVIDNPVKREA